MPPPRSSEVVLEFDRVWLTLDRKEVLRDVSFRLTRGETKVILGAAGSGKSVLLKTALGLFRPDSGRVRVFDQDITGLREEELYPIRQKIGMVFQEGGLFDSLNVAENVSYVFQEERELPPEEEEQRVREALRFVGLEEAIEKLPSELSGGMRRRVAIARAFVGEPPLMLYDSPTAGLDPVTAQSITTLIIQLSDLRNVSSLLVTHRLQDSAVLATYYFDAAANSLLPANSDGRQVDTNTSFLVLHEGEVAFDGSREELFASQDSYVRKFIG
jgi:phospholipid/cholesterol/gamma-HCH transport system ATP-binding protein